MFSNGNSTNFSEITDQGILIDSQIKEKNKTEENKFLQEKQILINPMLKAMENGNNFQNMPFMNISPQDSNNGNILNKFYNPNQNNQNNQNSLYFNHKPSESQISINSNNGFYELITNANYISKQEHLLKHAKSVEVNYNCQKNLEFNNNNNNNLSNKGGEDFSSVSNSISSKNVI